MSGSPKDSRGGNSADFLYSSYYTSVTRRIDELGVGGFTLVGFLLLVPPEAEFPQISSCSLPDPPSEAPSSMPDFVVLVFLSKQQNEMFLLKEPAQGWIEEVKKGSQVAPSQEKKERQRGEDEGEVDTPSEFRSSLANGI